MPPFPLACPPPPEAGPTVPHPSNTPDLCLSTTYLPSLLLAPGAVPREQVGEGETACPTMTTAATLRVGQPAAGQGVGVIHEGQGAVGEFWGGGKDPRGSELEVGWRGTWEGPWGQGGSPR